MSGSGAITAGHVHYDPVDGKEVIEGTEYAEKDGLFFGSLQTQQMFYKFLENGFQVVFESGKPKLVKTQGKSFWVLKGKDGKEGQYLRQTNECRNVIPGLPAGEYVFRAEVPELHKSTLKGTAARSMTVIVDVTSGDGLEKIFSSTTELKAQASIMEVKFTVWQKQTNATFVADFKSHSFLKKIYIIAELKQFPLPNIKEEINEARKQSKEIQKKGEYIVELTKGAAGVGMTLGWEKSLKAVVVKSIESNGAAARTKKLAVGDIVMGIQGQRMEGVRFKTVIKMLRNVPRTVVLIMSKAPEGFVPTRGANRTRKIEHFEPKRKRPKGAPPPPPRPHMAAIHGSIPEESRSKTVPPPPPPPPDGIVRNAASTRTSRPPPPRPARPSALGRAPPPPPPSRPSVLVSSPKAATGAEESLHREQQVPDEQVEEIGRKPLPPPPPTRHKTVPTPLSQRQADSGSSENDVKQTQIVPPAPPSRSKPPPIPTTTKPPEPPKRQASLGQKVPPPPPLRSKLSEGDGIPKKVPPPPPTRVKHEVNEDSKAKSVPPPPPPSRTKSDERQDKKAISVPPPPTPKTVDSIKSKPQVSKKAEPVKQTESSKPPQATQGAGDFAKYERMKKSNLPEGAIFNAWVRDGCPNYPSGFWSSDWENEAQREVSKRGGGLPPPKKVVITKKSPEKAKVPPGNPLDAIKGFNLSNLKSVSKEEESPSAKQTLPPSNPLAAINGFDLSQLKKVDRNKKPDDQPTPKKPTNPLDELRGFDRSTLRSHNEPIKRSEADRQVQQKTVNSGGGFQAAFSNALDQIRSAVELDTDDEGDDDWNDDDEWEM